MYRHGLGYRQEHECTHVDVTKCIFHVSCISVCCCVEYVLAVKIYFYLFLGHFMLLLDSESGEMAGNEKREKQQWASNFQCTIESR